MGANQVKDKQEFFSQLKLTAKGWSSKQVPIADVIKQVSSANRNKEISAFATRNNVKLTKFKFDEEFSTNASTGKKSVVGIRMSAQFVTPHQPIFIPCCGIMLRLVFSQFYYAAGSCAVSYLQSQGNNTVVDIEPAHSSSSNNISNAASSVEAVCYQIGKIHITTQPSLQVGSGNQNVRVNLQGSTMLAKFECFDSFIKWTYHNPNSSTTPTSPVSSSPSNNGSNSNGSSIFSQWFQSASSSDEDVLLTTSIRVMYSLPNCSTPVESLLELGKQLDVLSRKDCQPIAHCLTVASNSNNSSNNMNISAQCLFTNFVCDSVYNPSGLCFPVEKRFDFDPGFKLKMIKPKTNTILNNSNTSTSVPITPRGGPNKSNSNSGNEQVQSQASDNNSSDEITYLYYDRALIHEEDGDFMFTNRDNELQPQLRFTLPPKLSVKRRYGPSTKKSSNNKHHNNSGNNIKSNVNNNNKSNNNSQSSSGNKSYIVGPNITPQIGTKIMNSNNTNASVLDAILIFFNRDDMTLNGHLSRELLHMPCKKFVCNAGFKVNSGGNNNNGSEKSISIAAPKTFSISIAPNSYHRYLSKRLTKGGKFYTSLDGNSFQFDDKGQAIELKHGKLVTLNRLVADTSDQSLIIGDSENNVIENMYQFLTHALELKLVHNNTFDMYTSLHTLKAPHTAKFDLTTCMVSYKSGECEVRWNFEMERGTLVMDKDQRIKRSFALTLPLNKSYMHRSLWELYQQQQVQEQGAAKRTLLSTNVTIECVS